MTGHSKQSFVTIIRKIKIGSSPKLPGRLPQ